MAIGYELTDEAGKLLDILGNRTGLLQAEKLSEKELLLITAETVHDQLTELRPPACLSSCSTACVQRAAVPWIWETAKRTHKSRGTQYNSK